ncbi:MAG: thermonuclease family protein [Deltaproteobacteria bacterium]|nr:thermonuclease family protein [Deltaproteobacteria bacterium]
MKTKTISVLVFVTLTCLIPTPLFAEPETWQTHSYTVTRVLDGDTIQLTDGNLKFMLRIATIDAPEKAQSFGKVAKARLQELVGGKNVKIKPVGSGIEKYGRILGIAYIDSVDVSIKLIEEGLALYYRPFCKDYPEGKEKYDFDPRPFVEAEKIAKEKKLNFWSVKDVLPCEFRKKVTK